MSAALRDLRAPPARLLLAGMLLAVALAGVVASRIAPHGTVMVVQAIMAFLRGGGIAGPALFAALQLVVALSGALPASLLGIAAGAIYGLAPGFSLAATGTLLGAMIAFGLSRSLFRPSVERALSRHRRLHSLDALVARDGWKLVCLLRLSPIMPFSATSYVLGLSSVSLQDYLIGTLASLPALLGYVYLGTLTDAGLSAWTAGDSLLRWILLGGGAVATLLLMAYLGRLVAQRRVGTELIDRETLPANESPGE